MHDGPAHRGFGLSEVASVADANGLPWLARLAHGLQQAALARSSDAAWRLESCTELIQAADARGDAWEQPCSAWRWVGRDKECLVTRRRPKLADAAARFTDLDAPMLTRWCRARQVDRHRTARVAIRYFDEFRVEVAGVDVDLSPLRPQARHVLELLALSPGVDHHREYLEEALWPGVKHAVAATDCRWRSPACAACSPTARSR